MLVSLARPTLLVSDLTAAAQSPGVLRRFWSDGEVVAAHGVVLGLSSSPDLLFLCFMEVGSSGAETASYFDAQISEIFGVSGLFSSRGTRGEKGRSHDWSSCLSFIPCGSALQQALPRAGSGPLGLLSVGFVVAPVQISRINNGEPTCDVGSSKAWVRC
ncbi:hypothetical protein Bca4012_050655 [Brassica carinata]